MADNGDCAADEQPSYVSITLLGDAADPVLTAGRVLVRHQHCMFCRLKDWRRIATRFDRNTRTSSPCTCRRRHLVTLMSPDPRYVAFPRPTSPLSACANERAP